MAVFAIYGIKAMQAKILGVNKIYPERVAAALFLEANVEMTEAKKRTPVDVNYAGGRKPPHPGQLRASGTVHPPERTKKGWSITLSFGGAAQDYAVYVHEIIDNFHPVGQAKFLESTLNESRPYMTARLAKDLGL
jgi:hypothetical protein